MAKPGQSLHCCSLRPIWFLFGWVALCGAFVFPAPVGDLYDEALEAFRQEKYFEALTTIRRALGDDGENPAYLHLCGLTLAALGQFSEAESNLQRAVEIKPQDAAFQSDFAMVLLRQGKQRKALPLLQRAVELDGENLMARLYLGRTFHNLDHSQKARRQFEAILQRDPRFPSLHYHLAKLSLNEGKPAEALRELQLEVQHHPGNHLARFELGELLVKTGEPAQALPHLKAAEPVASSLERLYLTVAKAQRELGRLDEAIAAAELGIKLHPKLADTYYLLGQIYLQKGEMEMARVSLERFRKLGSSNRP